MEQEANEMVNGMVGGTMDVKVEMVDATVDATVDVKVDATGDKWEEILPGVVMNAERQISLAVEVVCEDEEESVKRCERKERKGMGIGGNLQKVD